MDFLLKHHVRIIAVLAAMLITLLGLLALLVWKVGLFYREDSRKYLKGEEVVVIVPENGADKEIVIPVEKVLFEYIEVIDSCGPAFAEACLNARSGPGEEYPKVAKLRNGVVLKVGGKVERDGRIWYKIAFDEKIRYPERVEGDWYVAADYVRVLLNEGNRDLMGKISENKKRIIVSRSEQMLYAYDGDELFMKEPISTGVELTPTPRGNFTIFKKMPSRYMQGPIPGITERYYDLPGVPWNLYFTYQGAVIHGTYWHENFGKPSSNGCVNLPPEKAEKLYNWTEVGTRVIVRD